ncbi:MAG: multiheme c-type cytochrome [Myxococcota bacterium]
MDPCRQTLGVLMLALGSVGVAHAAPTAPGELSNPLVPAPECQYCHSFSNELDHAQEPRYAPYVSWRGSMMANSARDPVFWAAVAIASQDAEDPAETQACVRCHAPRAFLEGRGDAIAQSELEFFDTQGVECELCHRMTDDSLPGNAQYALDDVRVGEEVPRRGPWSYPADGEIPPPPHEVIADTFIGTSAACGTCHDVTTPRERVDAEGVGMGVGFNEQRTYSEWAGSALAQPGEGFRSCQDCHMPAVNDVPGCREHAGEHQHATGGRRHDLLGANRFVIELLAADVHFPESRAFEHSLEQIDQFIQTAATLEVEAPDTIVLADGLSGLRTRVTNETGHKLPTGYSEGRVMWLEVEASLEGERVWSSGTWDPQARTIADDPQLRTYQAIAEDSLSGEHLHLLRNDRWVEDTRIPPRGLVPNIETDPVTPRYALQPDGTWPHFDEHEYAFEGRPEMAQIHEGTLEVSVRLLYLVNTAEYIDFLADANETNASGQELAQRFEAAGGATPMVLAQQSVDIAIVGPAMPGGSSGGSGDPPGDTDLPMWTATGPTGPGLDTDTGTDSDPDTEPGPSAEPGSGEAGGCQCEAGEGELPTLWLVPGVWLGWVFRRRTLRA